MSRKLPPEPDPFSDAEMGAWRSLLRLYSTTMRAVDAALQQEHGLGNTEYGVLVVLVTAPERSLRLGELAARHMGSPSGISRIVDRLEAAGLVVRRPHPEDGRGAFAQLTDEGVAKLRALQTTHHRVARERFLGRLTEAELSRFAELAERALPGVASSGAWSAKDGAR